MNPNTENPITAATTTAAALPTSTRAAWEAAGWALVIQPVTPYEENRLAKLGAVPSGHRKPNDAPHGSSCGDGPPDVGFYVPAAWLVGDDHETAKRWTEAGRDQGWEIDGRIVLVAPAPGGPVVFARSCGPDVCDWPSLDGYELGAVAGPVPPA